MNKKIKKYLIILILVIIIFNIFISGRLNLEKNVEIYFNENVFLILLSTYYKFLPEDLMVDTSNFIYSYEIKNFFKYYLKEYSEEIEKINKIFYEDSYETLIATNDIHLKNNIVFSHYDYYFKDEFNLKYFFINYNLGGIALKLKRIIKILDDIKKDKNYKFLKEKISSLGKKKIIKYMKKIKIFIKSKYNDNINLNNLKIYYIPFNNIAISYPSTDWSDTEHNRMWLSNINDINSFIVEIMHFYFNNSFKSKKEKSEFIEKYEISNFLKKVFNYKLNNEITCKNIGNDIIGVIDVEYLSDSELFYDEIFSNMFLLYYLYNNGNNFYYYKYDLISFIYTNISIFRSLGIYGLYFFENFKGKNVVKNFIKYFYNLKFKDIKEAFENKNEKIKNIIRNKLNLYIVNAAYNFQLPEYFIFNNNGIKNKLIKTDFFNNKIVSFNYKITVSVNIKKTLKNVYSVQPKMVVICSLKYPKFLTSMTFLFLSKYKSRQYFLKLKNMYNNNEIENLDYAILSYLDSFVFIYLKDLEQLPEIFSKLSSIDSDHYFKYK